MEDRETTHRIANFEALLAEEAAPKSSRKQSRKQTNQIHYETKKLKKKLGEASEMPVDENSTAVTSDENSTMTGADLDNDQLKMLMQLQEQEKANRQARLQMKQKAGESLVVKAEAAKNQFIELASKTKENFDTAVDEADAKDEASGRAMRKFIYEKASARGNVMHTPASWKSQTPASTASTISDLTMTTTPLGTPHRPRNLTMEFGSSVKANKANILPPLSEVKVVQEGVTTALSKPTATVKVLIGTNLDQGDNAVWAEITEADIPGVLNDKGTIVSSCMVGDCAVILKSDGVVYVPMYHKDKGSGYYYDTVQFQDASTIDFGAKIAAITSLENVLVATTFKGVVIKVEYAGDGKFGSHQLVKFILDDGKPYTPMASVAIDLDMNAYGFPAQALAHQKMNAKEVETSLSTPTNKAKYTKGALPRARTKAKNAGANKCHFLLAWNKSDKALAYCVSDSTTGKMQPVKKFNNGVLVDIAANSTHLFGCDADGKVSYSTNCKDWIEFSAGGNEVCKLAAGSSYVLGATDTGKVLVMKPEGGDVLGFSSYNFSTGSTGNKVEISHMAAHKDDYALVIVEESEASSVADVETALSTLSVADVESAIAAEENNEENKNPF